MLQELEDLNALWTHEQVRDALLEDYQQLKAAVAAAEQGAQAADQRAQEAAAALAALRDREKDLNRKLETASKRRDKTRLIIDNGQYTDYGVATSQLDRTLEQIDELETELLEVMEALEEAAGARARADNLAGLAHTKLAEARAKLETRTPEIRAALDEVTPLRDGARELLSHHTRSRYDALRARKKVPLADVRGGSCVACHVKLNATQFMEFRREVGLQQCGSCGRFLNRELDE
jgi:predicted  nucleic acid-binding Zn-ribbon protein